MSSRRWSLAAGAALALVALSATSGAQLVAPRPTIDPRPIPTLRPELVQGFGLSVPDGDKIYGATQVTLRLPVATGATGLDVKLTSSAPGFASFAPTSASGAKTLSIPGGRTSATFTVYPLTTGGASTLTAAALGQSTSLTVTSLANEIDSVAITPTTSNGCDTLEGAVKLKGAVPSDATVSLALSDAAVATLGSELVIVPAGRTTAPFRMTTRAVTAPRTVAVNATWGGKTTKSAMVTVQPVALTSFAISPAPVVAGNKTWARVTFDRKTTCATEVTFTSSDPTSAAMPGGYAVATGAGAGGGEWAIATPFVATATKSDRVVTFTATALGASKTASLDVLWPRGVKGVSPSPLNMKSGGSATFTVYLDMLAPHGGTTLDLRSTTNAVRVPSQVTVPEAQNRVTFTATAAEVTQASAGAIDVWNAQAPTGTPSGRANVTVSPP